MLKKLCILCGSICMIILCGCQPKNNIDEFETLDFVNPPTEVIDNNHNNLPFETIDNLTDNDPNYYFSDLDKINKDNLVNKDEVITNGTLEFKDFSFVKTKILPENVDMEDFRYFDECKINSDGDILDDSSYLFVTMTVSNLTNKELLDICWDFKITLIDEYETFYYPRSTESIDTISDEVRYNSLNKGHSDRKDYFFNDLKANETVSITTGFLFKDLEIDDPNLIIAPELVTPGVFSELRNSKIIWINR